jgi:hypothetical protein
LIGAIRKPQYFRPIRRGIPHAVRAVMPETPTRRFRPPTYENGQDIRARSFDYACEVVGFCEQLTESGGVGRLMVPQLLD